MGIKHQRELVENKSDHKPKEKKHRKSTSDGSRHAPADRATPHQDVLRHKPSVNTMTDGPCGTCAGGCSKSGCCAAEDHARPTPQHIDTTTRPIVKPVDAPDNVETHQVRRADELPAGSQRTDPPPWPSLAPPHYRHILSDTWATIRDHHMMGFCDKMFDKLFAAAEWSRKMFSHIDMVLQKKLFSSSLSQMLDDEESIKQLALHHSHMNVQQHQIVVFCRCIREAIVETLPEHDTFSRKDIERAWEAVLSTLQERFAHHLERFCEGIRTLEKGDAEQNDTEYLTSSAEIPADHCGYLHEIRLTQSRKGDQRRVRGLKPPSVAGMFSTPVHPSPKRIVDPADEGKIKTPPMMYLLHPPEQPPPPPVHTASTDTVNSNSLDETFGVEEHTYLPARWVRGKTVRQASHAAIRKRWTCGPDPPPLVDTHKLAQREKTCPTRLRDLGPVSKKRWVELKGQYLFYYSRAGGPPLGVVDMSECEVVDIEDEELSFSFALKRVLSGEDTLTLMADGDHDKEMWFMKLKRAYNRFSFIRPLQVGQSVRIKTSDQTKPREGVCLWVGSVVGTPLAWKGSGLWVGAELTEAIEGGHDGTFRGWSFFKCSPGRGVLMPAYKVEALDGAVSLADGIAHYRPNHFDFLAILGKGSFGCVCKVREKRTGMIYACKVLQKAALVREMQVRNLHREKSLLFKISHPYIVKLHAAFQTRGRLLLLFDFLSGGELWFHLSTTKGFDGKFKPFEEERALFYLAEVGLAVGYLHSQNILHRDLKLENLVLDAEGHVVLTDFGFAKTIDATTSSTTRCGTIPYMAPEVITKRGYGFKVDWWSLGVVFFIMLTGCYPFWVSKADGTLDSSATMDQIVVGRVIKAGNFPEGATLSAVATDLCCSLLTKDASKRLASIEDLKRHPAFRSFSWDMCQKRLLKPQFVPTKTGYNTKYFQNFSENEELSNLTIASGSSVGEHQLGQLRPPSGTNVPCEEESPRRADGGDCPFAHFTGVRHPSTHGSRDDPFDHNRNDTSSLYIFEAEM